MSDLSKNNENNKLYMTQPLHIVMTPTRNETWVI